MFNVGDKLFLRTVTYHMLGEVVAIEGNWVKLKNASWIADSGRFHNAIGNGTLSEVEYVGDAYVNLDTVADGFPWQHDLPTESE